jgi:hypothetical protein
MEINNTTNPIYFLKHLDYSRYDACGVTLSVYPHRASLKICPATVAIEPTIDL